MCKFNDVNMSKVKIVYLYFPKEFKDIQGYQKGNRIYINRSFFEFFLVPQYMPQVLQ